MEGLGPRSFSKIIDRYKGHSLSPFKVADSVLADRRIKDYGRSGWQAALSKAKRNDSFQLSPIHVLC